MDSIKQRLLIVLITGLMAGLTACQTLSPSSEQTITSLEKDIPEVRQGILQGYLAKPQLPDSLGLVDAPPEKGSAAFMLDQEIANKYVTSNDAAREAQAVIDADLSFPNATKAFNSVLPVQITEQGTPHLYMILRRSLADAGLSTYSAKNNYQRARPFMLNAAPVCTPQDEAALRKDGSYPSGHTAIGWAWALILVEVFPEQSDVILQRGKAFGESRNVCNVHWYSDVVAGRMMGAATVAKLHANENFLADLQAAKQELKVLQSK